MIVPPLAASGARLQASPEPGKDPALWKIAEQFEAQFVAEMLKHSGLNETGSAFGGGPGEEAFSSFLTEAYAQKIVSAGGTGVAESIYKAMLAQGNQR